jgi:hypothetical protein
MRRGWLVGLLTLSAAGASAQTTFTQVGSIPGPADLVEASGTMVYIAAGKTLTLVDVSNPAAPRRLGSHSFPDLIWNMTVSGSNVYVANDTSGLSIIDVSKPEAPMVLGSIRTPGQAKAVALAGSRAFVADHIRGIDVIDLSSPAKPTLTTSLFVDGFAKDVITRGTWLYALDQPNGLTVFDLSSRPLADPAGTLTLVNAIPLRAQLDVSDSASPRLAVVAGGGPIQIYDVSDPKALKAITTYQTPGNPQRMSLQGTRLYVAGGPAGLSVVDLAVPGTPAVVGSHRTAMPARDVAVAGSQVFVVAGAEVVILSERR